MKKNVLLIGLFGVFCSTTYSQTEANSLKVHDTRSIEETPDFNKRSLRLDFKNNDVIGLPKVNYNKIFSGLLTLSPWADPTGGLNYQLAFHTDGIYYRQGSLGSNSWYSWKQVLMSGDNISVKKIVAEEVTIQVGAGADFVFQEDYNLKALSELESFIQENKHLPEIPSEKQMQEEGLSVNEFQIKLLQKIEELTLYSIQQEKRIRELELKLNE